MTQKHPITPPPGLIKNWCASRIYEKQDLPLHVHVATQAARWGADQELEACCKLLELSDSNARDFLYSARRPKPPNLKEQALAALSRLNSGALCANPVSDKEAIRRALESLPD